MLLKKPLLRNLFLGPLAALTGMVCPIAHAEVPSYPVRTHSYSSFNTFANGDLRTMAMSGATVGLGDTFLASVSNPAGLAMTLNVGDTNITSSTVHDGTIQPYDQELSIPTSLGAALNFYPWGFSLGMVTIGKEGTSDQSHVGSHEFRIGAARLLFDKHLALGASINIGVGEEELGFNGVSEDRHAAALGATLGAMVQLPLHMLLGASYSTPMHYAIDTAPSPLTPGFFQPLDTPSRWELGVGWIPNRFIRGNIQASLIGKTPGAALLSNDTSLVGNSLVLEPRFGLAYIFLDKRDLQATAFTGTYEEFSRIDGAPNRLHGTIGMELKAWIFTAGIGIDRAAAFKNFSYSVGADLGVILQKLNLMPTPKHPKYEGFLPSPLNCSDDGLARPLVKHWKPRGPQIDPIKVVKDLPKNITKETQIIKKEVKETFSKDES